MSGGLARLWCEGGIHSEALTCEQHGDGVPALAHVLGGGEDEDLEGSVEGVDAVIEKLTERAGLSSSSSGVP